MEKVFYLGFSPYYSDDSNILSVIEEEQIPSVYNEVKSKMEKDGWKCNLIHRKHGFYYDDDGILLNKYNMYRERGESDKKFVALTFVMDFEKNGKNVMLVAGSRFDDTYDYSGYMFTPFDEKITDLDVYDYGVVVKSNDKKALETISNIIDKYTISCENQENLRILSECAMQSAEEYIEQYKENKKVVNLSVEEKEKPENTIRR